MADDGEPDGTAADDDRDVTLADFAASHRMQGDGHRFGQRGEVRRQSIGHDERHGRLDEDLFGVATGCQGRQPGQVHPAAGPHQWERHDERAHLEFLRSTTAAFGDLAAELVAHDHGRIASHEVLVSDRGHDVFEFARMMPGVQIRTADATAPHVEYELSLLWLRGRYVDDLEVSVETGDRLHRATPMDSMRRNASAVRSFSVAYPSMPMMRSASASRDRSTCTTPSTPPSAMP